MLLCKGCFVGVLAVFISIIPEPSVGISCYQCNSEYDPRCGNPFDPYSLGTINCTLKDPLEHMPTYEPVLCRKIVQKVYGKVRVVRGCGYLRDEERDNKTCVKRSGTHDVFAVYCSCFGDLCNKGTSLFPGHGIILIPLAILVTMTASIFEMFRL